ncbi:uncharacterized protein LOC122023966 [Zingiber officinale]|uniref:uncharacterized protein LOC122023966 n=1 Tax=Zingiber officinale TaxID=94328 RepID=UPI001C4D9E4C|nr:uncharacterized protein LOC122023966 [Zingiber officinale]
MPDSKETGTEEASIAAYVTFFLVCAALVLSLDLHRLSYFHLWLISQLILLTICVFYNLTKRAVAVQNPVDSWCESLYSPSASQHHHPAPEPERPSPPPPETGSSMDDTWKSIVEMNRRPRKQIERAPVADSRELRKLAVAVEKDFASSKKKAPPALAPAPQRPEKGEVRRRDVLYDQSEMLIKKHYDYLRVQRQESEKRRFFDRLLQQPS